MPTYEIKPVLPTRIAGLELRMMDLASDEPGSSTTTCAQDSATNTRRCGSLREGKRVARRTDLTPELEETALRHMDNCRECLRRMRDGIQILEQDQ